MKQKKYTTHIIDQLRKNGEYQTIKSEEYQAYIKQLMEANK